MADNKISTGQVYESCQPTFVVDGEFVHTRIKVVEDPIGTPGLYGFGKVEVVTLTDGGRGIRRRRIEVSQLHASGTTRTGTARRNGYRLAGDSGDGDD